MSDEYDAIRQQDLALAYPPVSTGLQFMVEAAVCVEDREWFRGWADFALELDILLSLGYRDKALQYTRDAIRVGRAMQRLSFRLRPALRGRMSAALAAFNQADL